MKRVNLLPQEIEENRSTLRERLIFIFVSAGLVVWLVVSFYGQEILMGRYRRLIAQKKENIQGLQVKLDQALDFHAKIQEERKKISAEKKGIADKLVLLKELKGEKTVRSQVLFELSQLIPLDIRLRKVSLTEEELLLAGEAADNMVVGHFMAQLDTSNLFERTSFNYIEKKEVEGQLPFIEFELTTHLTK